MPAYINSRQLEGNTLKEGDLLAFGKAGHYCVSDRHLWRFGGHNRKVFNQIGLKSLVETRDWTSKVIGMVVIDLHDTGVPAVTPGDYKSLTKIAMAIFEALEGKTSVKAVEVNKERFSAVISTEEQLLSLGNLVLGDKIMFTLPDGQELPAYEVSHNRGFYCHLDSCSGNEAIFAKLKINRALTRKVGEVLAPGGFPDMKTLDQLFVVVLNLFRAIAGKPWIERSEDSTIRNLADLTKFEEKGLVHDQRVEFIFPDRTLPYVRTVNHLSGRGCGNEEIFHRLGMSTSQKYDFASKAYDYKVQKGFWPECKTDDVEKASYRIVWALYLEMLRQGAEAPRLASVPVIPVADQPVEAPKDDVIRSLEDLKKVGVLKPGQKVEFQAGDKKYLYTVRNRHLSSSDHGINRIVMIEGLGMTHNEVELLAGEAYRKAPASIEGDWPWFTSHEDATRLVEEIFKALEVVFAPRKSGDKVLFPSSGGLAIYYGYAPDEQKILIQLPGEGHVSKLTPWKFYKMVKARRIVTKAEIAKALGLPEESFVVAA